MSGKTINLRQFMLGMNPYVVIELREATDGSGEAAVFLEPGGGATDQPLFLPLLVLAEHPAEGNPVAEMLRQAYHGTDPDAPSTPWRRAIEEVTRQFNADWIPFVTRDE